MMRTNVWLLAAITLAGCGATATTGTRPFGPQGFGNAVVGYRIDYVDAAQHHVLGPAWRVNNYTVAPDGTPLGDRVAPTDLVLRHRTLPSMIWADAAVVDASVERSELSALAETYVDWMSVTGYLGGSIVRLVTIAPERRRFQPTILDRRAITVAGQPGLALLVDLASEGAPPADIEARATRCLLVFVRLATPRTTHEGTATGEDPLVLVTGYANTPDEFDAHMPEFTEFLGAIRFPPAAD